VIPKVAEGELAEMTTIRRVNVASSTYEGDDGSGPVAYAIVIQPSSQFGVSINMGSIA
jgi:hypothetical protein